MAKNLKWSNEDLKAKGLVQNSAGDFVQVSSLVETGRVQELPGMLDDLDSMADSIGIGLYGADLIKPMNYDLFGSSVPEPAKPYIPPPVIEGQDILTIRALTGKARDRAIVALKNATEEMFAAADPACFYLRHNIPSLKNGKKIVTVKNINKKTGKPQEFSTLVPSDVVRDYLKESKGEWLQNKVAFRNAVQGLKLPISIEFTFIRDSLRRFDSINAAQIIFDLMVEYEYIPDDETVYLHPSFNKVVFYHKQLSGVLMRIIK